MEKFKVTLTVEERKRWNTWSPSARPPHASWPTRASCSWLMRDPAGRGDPTET